jgi:hypothetical protein
MSNKINLKIYEMPKDRDSYIESLIGSEVVRLLDNFVSSVVNQEVLNYDRFIKKILKLFKQFKKLSEVQNDKTK